MTNRRATLLVGLAVLVLLAPALLGYSKGHARGLESGNRLAAESQMQADSALNLAEQALDEANHWRRTAKEASQTIEFLESRIATFEALESIETTGVSR